VIERAAIVAAGPIIGEDDLPPLSRADVRARPFVASSADADSGAPPLERLETVERAHIVRVLESSGWVIEGKKGAAAVLGMAPSTLRSRMALLAIHRTGPR
jgi:transcriptional regulator with GAF, ATPase, and Fis domain